jgi:YfiH family protein
MNSSNPRFLSEHNFGHVVENSDVTAFFGDRTASKEELANAFPDYQFVFLKQTHSNTVVHWPFATSESLPEGDALITREHKIALGMRTADCVPVLIHDPESGTVAAVHAGWRGVANEILRKTGAELIHSAGTRSLKGARAWIGPHIGVASFEVDLDVAKQLEAAFDAVRGYSEESTALHDHENENKKYVNLLTIVRAQLGSIGIDREYTSIIDINTVMSPQHESFRRDRATGGRQISFITLK